MAERLIDPKHLAQGLTAVGDLLVGIAPGTPPVSLPVVVAPVDARLWRPPLRRRPRRPESLPAPGLSAERAPHRAVTPQALASPAAGAEGTPPHG